MLEPIPAWVSAFDDLPKEPTPAWAANMATKVDGLVTGKLELMLIKGSPAQFKFGKPAFQAALLNCTPSKVVPSAMMKFADAWAAGISASTWTVSVGAFIGAPAPPTMYGPLSTAGVPFLPQAITNPGSIALAKSSLVAALMAVPPSPNAAQFALSFRTAFLSIAVDVTGFNSIPYSPPATVPAPLPLIMGATA